MTSLLTKLHSNTRGRYLVIGVVTYLIELLVLFGAQSAGAPGTLAVTISFLVGLAISFLLQKVITFKDKRFHKKIVISQVIFYTALVAFNLSFTIVAVWALERYFPVAAIRTVALALTVVWNYYLYKSRIFNQAASSKHQNKRLFLGFATLTLAATTTYWSTLSALVQQYNSDQLADPELFENWSTFSQSTFPSQHTFLLKWPLFLIVQLAHSTPLAFVVTTVIVSLLTVGLFAWMLSRIEKRTEILALLFLAMSAVLLLVPIEPKPGSLLPVGIGMLTTRNIEYIVFLSALLLLFQWQGKRFVDRNIIIATLALALLFASDQLFVGLLFGGAVIAFIGSVIFKQKELRQRILIIFLIGIVATAISAFIFFVFRILGLLDSPHGIVGPYGAAFSPKDLAFGLIYGLMGILAQFGANPASAAVIITDLPVAILGAIRSPSILGYLANTAVFAAIVTSVVMVCKRVLSEPPKKHKSKGRTMSHFGYFVIATAIASIGLFVVTKHYYSVDARYMGIVFFAGFLALTLQLSKMKLHYRHIALASTVLVISCLSGLYGVTETFHASQEAYREMSTQNSVIAQALRHHPVKTLLADYWRVYPIVNETEQLVQPLPLDSCFEPRQVLTSRSWGKGVYGDSFAYLLTTETTGTGYSACQLAQVRAAFGPPSDSLVISGTVDQPETVVLFYDNGIKHSRRGVSSHPTGPSLVKNLDDLKDTECSTGQTILQTVAHQDDDLLFMNPDLLRGVASGDCVRTIYFTAGDAGADDVYWLGREEGAKASYARLFGVEKPNWRSHDIYLSDHQQVKIAQLQSTQPRASLIFVRLPDGGISGIGFARDHYQSLRKLTDGAIPSIDSVDGASHYTKATIVSTLEQLMGHYKPAIVRTQATANHSETYRDHADHLAVGQLTQEAFDTYRADHPETLIKHYIGYPIRAEPPNVADVDLATKESLFFTYAAHDPSTCNSDIACENTSYRFYLHRQYTE